MAEARLILIAAPELIPALRERVGDDDEVLTFSDSEPLRALEAITSQRPLVVALERLFAASPRGAALIARIKADPALDHSEILVLSHDTPYQRVSRRAGSHATGSEAQLRQDGPAAPLLDRGTRRAPRFRIRDGTEASVDRLPARLIDLSAIGAQVISPGVLRPKQSVGVVLGGSGARIQVAGVVVWARLELSPTGPAYRAGVEFTDPDQEAVGGFCAANRQE
jgi:hypothetical protein